MQLSTLAIIGYLLAAVVDGHLLWLRKRPAATLAWAWGILLFPYVGPLLYWAIGTDRLRRKRIRRRAGFQAFKTERRERRTVDNLDSLSASDAAFARLISRINEIPLTRTRQARLLPSATLFYDALKERIDAAQHHVHVQFFIWRSDEAGDRLRDSLVAAAQRGVQVRVLVDEIGSVLLPSKYFQPLIDAGGEFSWFLTVNPRRNRFLFNLRNHRKLQIIDGQIAFVGGMNVGREYQGLNPSVGPWRDLQIELHGPAATVLQESFADDWYFSTEKKLLDDVYYPPAELASAPWATLVVAGGPDSPSLPVQKSLTAILNHAQTRVWLTAGYFVPNEVTLTALTLCAARGVDVRLLVTEKTDHPALLRIGRSYYEELLRAGVRVFEYSLALNHAKAGVIDEDWLMVGSANLDNRSMRLNFELNILLRMPEEAKKLASLLDGDFAQSSEIKLDRFMKRPLKEKIFESVCRPFSPLM
ncbi:MAG TPA: cardiolipin synthase [Opitutaceae bacterium]|nr:cardiolipin synthase [Opitutaceae bacterium]